MKQIVLLLCFANCLLAQSTWTPQALPLVTSTGNAVAITDMNGDQLDDIIAANDENQLVLFTQLPDGAYRSTIIDRGLTQRPLWSITTADIDNDGRMDFTVAGEDITPVAYLQTSDNTYERSAMGFTSFFAQSSNAVDIDLDGMVDVLVCNDVAASLLYKNYDGLLEEWDLIDMTTTPASDNSGNYSSIWLDADGDLDLDLYIAKCRAGVTDPADPRRINALYINDNGTYREAAAEYGVAIGRQSWSVTSADLDNDGDEDLFITNHYDPDQILYQEASGFRVVDVELPEHFGLQGVIADLDLDGWQDIVIANAGQNDMILYNQSGSSWLPDTQALLPYGSGTSLSLGDLDNDGDIDLYKAKSIDNKDAILLNDSPAGHHWLKITLDHPSSAEKIMASVSIYGAWGVQTRRLLSGESYGITTSHTIHYGLGQHAAIDSATVRWHDSTGTTTTYHSLPIDRHVLLSQQGCVGHMVAADVQTHLVCSGSQAMLALPAGYEAYLWSDGSMGQMREAEPGQYTADLVRADGCIDRLYPILVDSLPQLTTVIEAVTASICNGSSMELAVAQGLDVLWSTGDTSTAITVDEPLQVSVAATDLCGTTYYDTLSVEVLSTEAATPLMAEVSIGDSYPLALSQSALLRSSIDGSIHSQGSMLTIDNILRDSTAYYSYYSTGEALSGSVGLPSASQRFASNTFNSGITFEVERTLILRSVQVYTDVAATRKIDLLHSEGGIRMSTELYCDTGLTTVPLDVLLEPGTYTLTTDASVNSAELGEVGPRFSRTSTATFPYRLDNDLTLLRTLHGVDSYYYFYNWQVDYELAYCESNRASISLRTTPTSAVVLPSEQPIIYPNPALDYLYTTTTWVPNEARATDLLGRTVPLQIDGQSINVSALRPGWYYITLSDGTSIASHKVMIGQ